MCISSAYKYRIHVLILYFAARQLKKCATDFMLYAKAIACCQQNLNPCNSSDALNLSNCKDTM